MLLVTVCVFLQHITEAIGGRMANKPTSHFEIIMVEVH